jgi:hypothetical protein
MILCLRKGLRLPIAFQIHTLVVIGFPDIKKSKSGQTVAAL